MNTRIEKNGRGKPREKCTVHAFTEWFAVSNDKRTEYGLVISSFHKHYKNTDRDRDIVWSLSPELIFGSYRLAKNHGNHKR